MADNLEVLEIDADNIIRIYDLIDESTEEKITGASVSIELRLSTGALAPGVTWPLNLAEVSSSPGDYYGFIPRQSTLDEYQTYDVKISVNYNGGLGVLFKRAIAKRHTS